MQQHPCPLLLTNHCRNDWNTVQLSSQLTSNPGAPDHVVQYLSALLLGILPWDAFTGPLQGVPTHVITEAGTPSPRTAFTDKA